MDDIENNEYKFYNYDIENIRDIFYAYQIQRFHLLKYLMEEKGHIYYRVKP